jgi:hypothetical protein
MSRAYPKNCPFCRLMRSLAFTGVGMGLGGGVAYLLGASKENIMMSGIFVAAVIVFGLMGKKQ